VRFVPTDIADVIMIEPTVFRDERGFFLETWQTETARKGGIDVTFVQDNHSQSATSVLRGLHYQLRRPQGKLVRVTAGSVFDVAVDLRKHSPTFGHWTGIELSDTNHRILWIPPGFAHGFYVIRGPADFIYKCTEYYVPGDERCIRWDDPDLAISWPVPKGSIPIVGKRDMEGVRYCDAETFP
jgi:dTDP-4-dehydrorhamnose 3,5-epimerase